MKVLFASNLFPDTREPYRGLDNAVLLQHLSREFEIRVVSPRPALFRPAPARIPRQVDAPLQPLFLDYSYVPKLGSLFNHLLYARSVRDRLHRLHREFAFDVILVSWTFPDAVAIARLQSQLNVPFVAIVQGSDAHAYLRMPLRRPLIVSALNQSAGAITRSAKLAKLLKDAGVEEQKLHPVYNGVDLELFHPASNKSLAKSEVRLNPSATTLLFVGNLFPIKNPELLVRAFSELCRKREGCYQLVMIGGGPLEGHLRNVAAQLGCARSVVWVGRKDASEVAAYMRAADLLCLSSDNEGVPNVVLEAFASGLPVMSTAVGGLPEVVCGGFLGKLVEPRNVAAMAATLAELLDRRPETQRIRAHAQEFSWSKAAARYGELLRAAC